MSERLPEFSEAIKVNVSGCPNSCGQHWIADVGLQGVLINQGETATEGFDFFVGGGLGARSAVAHRVGFRATADDVPDALERLFGVYDRSRAAGESFRAWAVRAGDAALKHALAGR
jgi:sulfite reductase (ferredoxin)